MTINGLIEATQVRRLYGDSIAPYRFDDTVLLAYWNAGRRDLFNRRPEALYVTGILTSDISDVSSLGSDVDVRPIYYNAMAYYLAARVLMEDMENPGNAAKGNGFMQMYISEVA